MSRETKKKEEEREREREMKEKEGKERREESTRLSALTCSALVLCCT